MRFSHLPILSLLLRYDPTVSFFHGSAPSLTFRHLPRSETVRQSMTAGTQPPTSETTTSVVDYNSVHVEKKLGTTGSELTSDSAWADNLSLGAPRSRPTSDRTFFTKGGIEIISKVTPLEYVLPGDESSNENSSTKKIEDMVDMLDRKRGGVLSSSYEFPGRYARWSLGFVDPPLEISGRGNTCTITALNSRGKILLPAVLEAMRVLQEDDRILDSITETPTAIIVTVVPPSTVGTFSEEDRSKQPSLFSVVRALTDLFSFENEKEEDKDHQLGLYGAFGYDLTFQFEPIDIKQTRDENQRDLLLYLPDEIVVVDQKGKDAWMISYDFASAGSSTVGLPRDDDRPARPFRGYRAPTPFEERDTPVGRFAHSVERAKEEFKVGNLFECVLSQTFRHTLPDTTPPSKLFRRLKSRNPSPYGFIFNLGEDEFLVGASPEMFVRCERSSLNDALRVETCPISGTVARGQDALEDAKRVKSLLTNLKEESELTMCTDVDRNDKSRICVPGTVRVIGRRQIEMYSRLIHTVDHVEGYLRKGFDALDAFLCHTWAVTVTGAPKTWAIQFVEDMEYSPRCWYGGAVGMVGFDGSLNTGLTLRTVRVKDGVAEVRAGATLLYDSDADSEEQETELKASAMLDAIVRGDPEDGDIVEEIADAVKVKLVGEGKKIVLIDHEDSFVHTLGNYLRQTGADVVTLRSGKSALDGMLKLIQKGEKPDMVVLSPGPGSPSDFAISSTIDFLTTHKIPTFGVCLGLQGIVEHFGGTLGVLSYPMHGKPSPIYITSVGKSSPKTIFKDLPETFEVARYHSLYGVREHLPKCMEVTALSEDGIVMGIQHSTLPFAAVQFHPESILTSPDHGMKILENAIELLRYDDDDDEDYVTTQSAADLTAELEAVEEGELRERCKNVGISDLGGKSDLLVRMVLWTHKREALKNNRLVLNDMTEEELLGLMRGLGLKEAEKSIKEELVNALHKCLTGNL